MTDSCPTEHDHAAAYRELDGPLHDLQNTCTLLAALLDGLRSTGMTQEQFNAMHFAARNVSDQMTALLKAYDADFELLAAA